VPHCTSSRKTGTHSRRDSVPRREAVWQDRRKQESSKINPERVACFSSPKNDPHLTSVSPAIPHKFASEKPCSAHAFAEPPQAKTEISIARLVSGLHYSHRLTNPTCLFPAFCRRPGFAAFFGNSHSLANDRLVIAISIWSRFATNDRTFKLIPAKGFVGSSNLYVKLGASPFVLFGYIFGDGQTQIVQVSLIPRTTAPLIARMN
jgi:hypothetical protein